MSNCYETTANESNKLASYWKASNSEKTSNLNPTPGLNTAGS